MSEIDALKNQIAFLEKCRADLLCDMASARQEIKRLNSELAQYAKLNKAHAVEVDNSSIPPELQVYIGSRNHCDGKKVG